MKKSYAKTGETCRVTFELPADLEARTVALCGEFNDWDPEKHLLKQRKDGSYSVTVSLQSGQSYRYRFLLDRENWENDWSADAYAPNAYGSEDSIVKL